LIFTFSDGQVSLQDGHGGSGNLFFFDNLTSSLRKTVIDTSHRVHGAGNLGFENGFLESGFSSQTTSIIEFSGGGDNLTGTSVDGISV
jgi:hypothetical protein